jgi:hypothetical protein
VTIGNSVERIGSDAFENCSGLISVIIPNSVKDIGWSTFENCSNLTSITIGNKVDTIYHYAFRDCSKLTNITNLRSTPPREFGIGVFQGVNMNTCTLRVPAGAVETYKVTYGWKDFKNIVGI